MPDTDGIAWAGFVGRGGLLANALTTWPIFNPYDAEGNLKNNFFEPVTVNAQANPIWNAKVITNKTKSMRLLSNAFAQYSPIEGLVLKTTINMEYFSTKYQNRNTFNCRSLYAFCCKCLYQQFRIFVVVERKYSDL